MPIYTQTTNYQVHVQEDEVGDSQDSNIAHTKDDTEFQEAHIAPIDSTANKIYQEEIYGESQYEIINGMDNKYG